VSREEQVRGGGGLCLVRNAAHLALERQRDCKLLHHSTRDRCGPAKREGKKKV